MKPLKVCVYTVANYAHIVPYQLKNPNDILDFDGVIIPIKDYKVMKRELASLRKRVDRLPKELFKHYNIPTVVC